MSVQITFRIIIFLTEKRNNVVTIKIVSDKVSPSIRISIYELDMGEHYWTQMIFEHGIFVAKMLVCINAGGVERGFKCSCS